MKYLIIILVTLICCCTQKPSIYKNLPSEYISIIEGKEIIAEKQIKSKIDSIIIPYPENTGSNRSAESVLKVIRTIMPKCRYTYNYFLKKHPRFKGSISLRLDVLPNGKLNQIIVTRNSTGKIKFANAIVRRFKNISFEPVTNDKIDYIELPLTFSE